MRSLEDIKQGLTYVTEGPWYTGERTDNTGGNDGRILTQQCWNIASTYGHEANAAFIANARTDVPDLVAQLAASQAEYEALHANFITLGMANEVYKNELRQENARLQEVLGEFVADDAAGHIEHEDGYMECQYCDGQGTYDWTSKTYTYAHTADCLVTRARALLTPPAAPEADTSAPVTD